MRLAVVMAQFMPIEYLMDDNAVDSLHNHNVADALIASCAAAKSAALAPCRCDKIDNCLAGHVEEQLISSFRICALGGVIPPLERISF